jgi:hypothetical protein
LKNDSITLEKAKEINDEQIAHCKFNLNNIVHLHKEECSGTSDFGIDLILFMIFGY